jgi:hypothetical protein
MFTLFQTEMFPFIKSLSSAQSAFSTYMKDASFLIPTPKLLQKVVDLIGTKSFIKGASVETEIQKVLSEYIEKLLTIDALKSNEFINDDEIRDLKHQVFDYEQMVTDRLSNQDEFSELLKEVMNTSKKEIANKIFDNYIENGSYTHKQIEVSNKIKNVLFGKKYATLEASLSGVNENLLSDIHPLATVFERLSEEEQEMIFHLMGLLNCVNGYLK